MKALVDVDPCAERRVLVPPLAGQCSLGAKVALHARTEVPADSNACRCTVVEHLNRPFGARLAAFGAA